MSKDGDHEQKSHISGGGPAPA